MHPGAETSVADESVGMLEALNVTNGGQQGHRRRRPMPVCWISRHLTGPRLAGALQLDGRLDLVNQGAELVESQQVLRDQQALDRRQSPAPTTKRAVQGREIAFGRQQVVVLQQTLQAVTGLGALLDPALPLTNECA